MDPYDKEKTREIWQRVLDGGTAQDSGPERLRAWIAGEQRSAAVCAALARRVPGGEALARISREERAHSRSLETLLYLRTGERSVPAKTPVPGPVSEALRTAHRRALEAAAQYAQAAETMPEHAALLRRMAEEERRHAAQFFLLLERSLASGSRT